MEEFKKFVKNNPQLASYVINDNMTWQKFYELYDLYGEYDNIWDNYKSEYKKNNININGNFKELFNIFKNIDYKSIQNTLQSIIEAIDSFNIKDNKNNNIETNTFYED